MDASFFIGRYLKHLHLKNSYTTNFLQNFKPSGSLNKKEESSLVSVGKCLKV